MDGLLIGGIKMAAKRVAEKITNNSIRKTELYIDVLSKPENRRAIGTIILCSGIGVGLGVGGGLIVSSYIYTPEQCI